MPSWWILCLDSVLYQYGIRKSALFVWRDYAVHLLGHEWVWTFCQGLVLVDLVLDLRGRAARAWQCRSRDEEPSSPLHPG